VVALVLGRFRAGTGACPYDLGTHVFAGEQNKLHLNLAGACPYGWGIWFSFYCECFISQAEACGYPCFRRDDSVNQGEKNQKKGGIGYLQVI
jgi:hypothetical protein